jgi:hypothetical protein
MSYADASALSSYTYINDSAGNNLNPGYPGGGYMSVPDSVIGTRMFIPYLNTAPPTAPTYNLVWKTK